MQTPKQTRCKHQNKQEANIANRDDRMFWMSNTFVNRNYIQQLSYSLDM